MNDLFSEANRAAASIRDLYEAFIRFGFSRQEAFTLTVVILQSGARTM